jgi:glycosyltransferase involved in cell wall biosynthesis
MNILMPIYSCDPEGESERLIGFDWLQQISRQHQVFLITPVRYKKALEKRITRKVTAYYLPVPEFGNLEILSGIAPGYFVFMVKAYFLARKIIKDHKVDIIHRVTPIAFRFPDLFVTLGLPCVIGPVGGGLKPLAAFPSVFKKENFMYQLRRLDDARFLYDPWLRYTYTRAARILITCNYVKDIIPFQYHHKLRLKSEATINTADYPCVIERRSPVARLLYVGRFIPLKAVNLLIRALQGISWEDPQVDFQATLIGDGGDYYQYCRDMVKKAGLEKKITFLGRLKREAIIAYYHSHDIFCFPSLKESSGCVVMEAMSCGIPVIVADRGGPAEIVAEGCGLKIAVHTEEDFVRRLKEAILLMIKDKDLRHTCAANARRWIENKYDTDSIAAMVTSVYKEIL